MHFVATMKCRERLLKVGEAHWRIHLVGAPAVDRIHSHLLPSVDEVKKKYGLPSGPYIFLTQHPVPEQHQEAAKQIKATLRAIDAVGLPVIASLPNSNVGGEAALKILSARHGANFLVHPNIEHLDYLALLKGAAALVGNSSSGIIEAPSFKTPVVNIGIRQAGRERCENVIDAPHGASAIEKAIRKALSSNFKSKCSRLVSPYGNGTASYKIANCLAKTTINQDLFDKRVLLP